MDAPREYIIPAFFPRHPLLKGLEQQQELRSKWNMYLAIPKGNAARRAYVDALRQEYGESLVAFYQSSQDPVDATSASCARDGDRTDVCMSKQEEVLVGQPSASKKQKASLDPSGAQANTHYTPLQTALAEQLAQQCEKLAREHAATLLDIRKAWDYWQAGNLYFQRKN